MTVETKLDQLDQLYEERQFWSKVLRLWEHAKEHLNEEQFGSVKAFTFCDKYLDKRKREHNISKGKNAHYSGVNYHNAVRLKSGDLQEIPLIERPKMPEGMTIRTRTIL